jgi:hypothetical protein
MALKGTRSIKTPEELFQIYSRKAAVVHHFAENLAQTLGVFHGINQTGQKLLIDGEPSGALGTILFDQLQIMVLRICALCDKGSRDDDASLSELVNGLSDHTFQQFLIEKERRWARAVGFHRAGSTAEIQRHAKTMKARWTPLSGEKDALSRIQHYRNKVLAHATTGLDPGRKVLIRDIWRISRLVLSVAKYVRLVLEREEWDYLDHSADGRAVGKALVLAVHRDSKARSW